MFLNIGNTGPASARPTFSQMVEGIKVGLRPEKYPEINLTTE